MEKERQNEKMEQDSLRVIGRKKNENKPSITKTIT